MLSQPDVLDSVQPQPELSVYNLTKHEARIFMKVRSNGQHGYYGHTRQFKSTLKPRKPQDGSPNSYYYETNVLEGHGFVITVPHVGHFEYTVR